jgi:predicted transcriptional regulator
LKRAKEALWVMKVRTAEEMMVPIEKYPHISESKTLAEAIRLLKRCQIVNADGRTSSPRVLVVVNEGYQFVGIVRRRDILRGLEPGFLVGGKVKNQRTAFDVPVDSDVSELSYDKIIEGMRNRAHKSVSEVMTPIAATVNHDDHLMKAVNELVKYNTSILPVLKEGRVIGILRTLDVLHEVATILDISWNSA